MDQQRFEFPRDEAEPRRKRYRRRRPLPTPRQPVPPSPLISAVPLLQRCGLCGHRNTIHGESAICEECGGIILRKDTREQGEEGRR